MYFVQNSHPAIISRETFHKVQEELIRRKTRTPLSSKAAITPYDDSIVRQHWKRHPGLMEQTISTWWPISEQMAPSQSRI